MKWKVVWNNDTGMNDEGYWEWWEVTDGVITFKADTQMDADWLCFVLNNLE